MNDNNGWITVKRSRRKAKKKTSDVINAVPIDTGSTFSHQDYAPVVLRRQKPRKTAGTRTAVRRSGTAGYATSIEKKAHDGSYACTKYDRKFINSVIAIRTKLGLKQIDLNNRLALPPNTIKNLEAGKLVYNPQMKQRIENKMARLK